MSKQGKKKAEQVDWKCMMKCTMCNRKFLRTLKFMDSKGWKTPACPSCGLTIPVMWVETRLRQYA
jgi:DNA-directed RNA polymerase subunit RPC12/RpoP